MIIIWSYPFVLASTAEDVNVDQGRRWTNSLLSAYMFVVVIIIIMMIIITSLFTEDNIVSTYLKYGHHFQQMLNNEWLAKIVWYRNAPDYVIWLKIARINDILYEPFSLVSAPARPINSHRWKQNPAIKLLVPERYILPDDCYLDPTPIEGRTLNCRSNLWTWLFTSNTK